MPLTLEVCLRLPFFPCHGPRLKRSLLLGSKAGADSRVLGSPCMHPTPALKQRHPPAYTTFLCPSRGDRRALFPEARRLNLLLIWNLISGIPEQAMTHSMPSPALKCCNWKQDAIAIFFPSRFVYKFKGS